MSKSTFVFNVETVRLRLFIIVVIVPQRLCLFSKIIIIINSVLIRVHLCQRSWPNFILLVTSQRLAISFDCVHPLSPIHFSSFHSRLIFPRYSYQSLTCKHIVFYELFLQVFVFFKLSYYNIVQASHCFNQKIASGTLIDLISIVARKFHFIVSLR